MNGRGRFIVFEGAEASGKSTQARLLASSLDGVLTREPGATPLGALIRGVLLSPETGVLDARAEALLLAADRAQHVASVIRPMLAAGHDVVSDRYIGSSLAYQGYGRGLAVEEVRRLSEWATGGLWPDLVILLDVPAEETVTRLGRLSGEQDRMEAAGDDFHGRVAAGYRALAEAGPGTWRVVDGRGRVDEVEERVKVEVERFFGPA